MTELFFQMSEFWRRPSARPLTDFSQAPSSTLQTVMPANLAAASGKVQQKIRNIFNSFMKFFGSRRVGAFDFIPSKAGRSALLKGNNIIYERNADRMLKSLNIVYRESMVKQPIAFAILRLLSALRIILFPRVIFQFHSMNVLEKLHNPVRKHDPLYFLVHNYYISRRFTLGQRVRSAMTHHKFELEHYKNEYMRLAYRASGVVLWERNVDNFNFTIVLVASEDNRHEGDLSVILSVNNVRLCRMAFSYLDASIFGLAPNITLLISRNQTDRTPCRDTFTRCFGQNTPQFFCLSAICGIAMTNEFDTILAIKHDAQIAYEKALDSGFRNSYSALWEKFDGVEIDSHVYRLNVPLKLRPLDSVNRAHRGRARDRRMQWDDIAQSTRSVLNNHRIASAS